MPADLWHWSVRAAGFSFRVGLTLVPLAQGEIADGKEPGRPLADGLRAGIFITAPGTRAVAARDSDGRFSRTSGGRFPDPLLEPRRRLHRLRNGSGRGPLPVDCIFLLQRAGVDPDPLRVRLCVTLSL